MVQRLGERQTIWGWKVAAYLFLAGLGAGSYLLGSMAQLLGDASWDHVASLGVTMGPPLVAVSTAFLVWDLGRPMYFFRAGFRPRKSWISRGFFILGLFIVTGFVHVLLRLAQVGDAVQQPVAVVGAALSLGVMVYTGFLLGAVRAIPFWSSPVLPLLFSVSAVSTGVMVVSLASAVGGLDTGAATDVQTTLLRADTALLVLESMTVLFYLYVGQGSVAGRGSVQSLVRGALRVPFWVGFVMAGLVAPLAVEALLLTALTDAGEGLRVALTTGGMALGLLGGYMLRHLIVAAGIKAPLVAFGRTVPVHGRARLPV